LWQGWCCQKTAQQNSAHEAGEMTDKPALKVIQGRKGAAARCPVCQQAARMPHSPFCSRRCAQIDLGHWLNGDYAVPAYEAGDDADLEALIAAAEADPELKG